MTQFPLLAAQPHRNQKLFSGYYLNHLLPQRADWHALAPEARTTLERIAAIVAGYTPSTNEAQTEDGLIKPVLAALGHTIITPRASNTRDLTQKFPRSPCFFLLLGRMLSTPLLSQGRAGQRIDAY